MCGFCGYHVFDKRTPESPDRIQRMTDALAHRGPDGQGVHLGDGVALGHRRLSIIDLSPTGAQPMRLPERDLWISYNGEVYNFRELREILIGMGCAFRGRSDTEVILNAYAVWGLEGLTRLEGIFAFALWDGQQRRLVLMRDRLGVKPLFYGRAGDMIAFGSEIKAVLAAGGIDDKMDPQALAEYLWYGNAFEDRTIYQDVRAVPPGHWLIVEQGRLRLEAWWKLEEWIKRPRAAATESEAAPAVRRALDDAVGRQLVADVPVGIFLSGGVDSSAIAAAAVRTSSSRLSSYSVGFDFDRGVNELPKAARVANLLGLDHHELSVTAADLPEVLVAIARAHDEPFADAANIPLYLLSRAIREEVKVVLQGDGGDEMFAGYRRYAILRNAALWRAIPDVLVHAASRLGSAGRRFARMARAVGANNASDRMSLLLTVETREEPPTSMLRADARRELEVRTDPFLAYRRCADRFISHEPVQQMLLTDLTLQLPSQFLAKVDRATMAQGVEARVPLLDERIGELAVGLPSQWKVRGAQKKIVLRDAMRARLPPEILDGPKTGFGVPYEHWLRGALHEFARERVLEPAFVQALGFDRLKLESTLAQHRSGERDRGFLLWKILQLALWRQEAA